MNKHAKWKGIKAMNTQDKKIDYLKHLIARYEQADYADKKDIYQTIVTYITTEE